MEVRAGGRRQTVLDAAGSAAGVLCVCAGKISGRPGLVVLSFLGAGIPASETRVDIDGDGDSDRGHLLDFGCGERWGRMDFLVADQARTKRQLSAKDGDVALRGRRDPSGVRVSSAKHMGCV